MNRRDRTNDRSSKEPLLSGSAGVPGRTRANSTNIKQPSEFEQELVSAAQSPEGVFVYGTEKARGDLRNNWVGDALPGFQKNRTTGDTAGYTTVDVMNNETWREYKPGGVAGKHLFSDTSRDGSKLSGELEAYRKSATAKRSSTEQELAKDYGTEMLADEWSRPQRTLTTDRANLQAKEYRKKPDEAMFRSQTIKACKFGIDYAATRGRTVLFALDGLDSESTVGKRSITKHYSWLERIYSAWKKRQWAPLWVASQQQRSISGAELRKAFRADPGADKLKFFNERKSVPAPWMQAGQSEQWRDYLQKRLTKFQGLVGADHSLKTEVIPPGDLSRAEFRDINMRINKAKRSLGPPPSEGWGSQPVNLGPSAGSSRGISIAPPVRSRSGSAPGPARPIIE